MSRAPSAGVPRNLRARDATGVRRATRRGAAPPALELGRALRPRVWRVARQHRAGALGCLTTQAALPTRDYAGPRYIRHEPDAARSGLPPGLSGARKPGAPRPGHRAAHAPGGVVYLSGRRLDCAPPVGNQGATRCTVSIAGEPLELLARRNGPGDSNQLGGICRARYAGREWPCSFGLRHVHVAWFAIIPEPLDLSPAQLEQLRRQQPLENLPERALWSALLFVPVLTASVWQAQSGCGSGVAAGVSSSPRPRSSPVLAPGPQYSR